MILLHRLVPPALVALSLGACGGNDPPGCPAGFVLCAASNTCVLSAADCATGPGAVIDCGSGMVDTSTNPAHCGACGNACGAGFVCAASACACPGGQTDCGGTCVDLNSSAANCGDCGAACTGGAVCSVGACSTAGCGTGLTLCGSDCVNLMEHGDHCGECDVTCDAGALCIQGACTVPEVVNPGCAENQYLCDGVCVNHNGLNCGGCGLACRAGEVCTSTGCVGPTVVECDPTDNPTKELCGQWDRLGVNCTEYVYQNNRWNPDAESQTLCATVTGTSFTISSSGVSVGTSGGPAAYTSFFKGCHESTCSDATKSNLPIQVSALNSATSSWSFSTAGGSYNVSYDLWILPGSGATYETTAGGTELMIWLDRSGVQPIGSQQATATVDGTSWAIWWGGSYSTGANVISYVRSTSTNSVTNLNLKAFIDDAVSRGQASSSNYLKSIEAGFEIWNGCQGMKTNSFSASVN